MDPHKKKLVMIMTASIFGALVVVSVLLWFLVFRKSNGTNVKRGSGTLSKSLLFPSRASATLAPIAYNIGEVGGTEFNNDEMGYFGLECVVNTAVYDNSGPLSALTSPSGVFNKYVKSTDVGVVKLQAPVLQSSASVSGWIRTAKWLLTNDIAVEMLIGFTGESGGARLTAATDIPGAIKTLKLLQDNVPPAQQPHIGLCMDFEKVQSASDWKEAMELLPPARRNGGPFVLSIFVEKSGSFLSELLFSALDYVTVMFYANADNIDRFVSDMQTRRTVENNKGSVSFTDAIKATNTPVQLGVETTWMAEPSKATCAWIPKSTFVAYSTTPPKNPSQQTALGSLLATTLAPSTSSAPTYLAGGLWAPPPANVGIPAFSVESLRAWTQLERNVETSKEKDVYPLGSSKYPFPATQSSAKTFCQAHDAVRKACLP